MYANVYEMRLPANYVDMTADEMEYDGGWFWFAAIIVVGPAVMAVGHYTGNKAIKTIGAVMTGAGLASTGVRSYFMATSTTVTTADGAVLVAGITSDTLSVCSAIAGI